MDNFEKNMKNTNQVAEALADFHNIHSGRKPKNPNQFSNWVSNVVSDARQQAEHGKLRCADCCRDCILKEDDCPVVGNVYHKFSCEYKKYEN